MFIFAGYFKYGKRCEDGLRLPITKEDQTLVPNIIDAAYAVAVGLHDHINKHCSDGTLCKEAR